jgi:predicted Zn-dependent protease
VGTHHRHLEAAIQSLPESTGPGVDDVEHYLQVNELGLAFDVLAEVGAQQRAKRAFWKCLERAADEMKARSRRSPARRVVCQCRGKAEPARPVSMPVVRLSGVR